MYHGYADRLPIPNEPDDEYCTHCGKTLGDESNRNDPCGESPTYKHFWIPDDRNEDEWQ